MMLFDLIEDVNSHIRVSGLIIKWVMKVNIESDEMEFLTGGCQPGEMKNEEET